MLSPVDVEVARTAHVTIGQFRCPVHYASFGDTGPISRALVAFPRSSVWIEHAGSERFLADPGLVTIYNRGQEYRRYAGSPDGDRCEWFALSDEWARDVAASFDSAGGDSDRPFRPRSAQTSSRLYLAQRELFNAARAGRLSKLELEEGVLGIVTQVLASAHRTRPATGTATSRRRRALVDRVRQLLLAHPAANISMHEMATAVGASAFHACRVFRAETGGTIHEYRLALRLRLGLESLESRERLSTVAYRLGFSSHSHFTDAARYHFGLSPSRLRARLGAVRAEHAECRR